MHIVQCLSNSSHGGAQQVVYLLVTTLRKLYPDVRQSVVLPEGGVFGDRFRSLGIDVYHISLNRISSSVTGAMRGLFRSVNPSVVHTHGKGAGLYGRRARRRELQYRTIHSFHGFHPKEGFFRRFTYLHMEQSLAGSTDVVVSVSRSEADEIAEMIPGLSGKISLIPNVVDPAITATEAREDLPDALQDVFRTSSGSFIVTMIGRDDPLKNYPLAFQTAALVMEKLKNVDFMLVGGNPDGEDARRVKAAFPGRLHIIPAVENTASIIARSSVLLMTSRKEGAPLSILEAFALGIPAVGTNVPGIRDTISDQQNGILCDENPESLCRSLERIVQNPAYLAKLRDGARAAAAQFDPLAWGRSYGRVYGLEGG